MIASYVLNLDRRKDKWEKAKQRFEKTCLIPSRFSAVDGSCPNFQKEHKDTTFKSFGTLACLLSHIKILEDAVTNKHENIAVFEDDVVFSKNFNLDFLKNFNNWGLIYLGASQVKWNNIEIKQNYYHPNDTLGTWAMLINCSMYDRLLTAYKKMEASADLTLAKELNNDPNCYVIYPNLCMADVSSSDIREYKMDQNNFNNKCKWDLDLYNFHQTN